jgi:hypothetical protein
VVGEGQTWLGDATVTTDANAGRKATVPITFAVPGESAFAAKAKPKAGRR